METKLELDKEHEKFVKGINFQLEILDELLQNSAKTLHLNQADCTIKYYRLKNKYRNYFWKFKEKLNSQYASCGLESELLGYAIDIRKNINEIMKTNKETNNYYKEIAWNLSVLSYVLGIVGATIEKNKDMSVYAKIKVAKDEKQKALNAIKGEFLKCSYPFHKHGYKTKFSKEMLIKYPLIEDNRSVMNLINKLLKEKKNEN